ncbi:MAG TPA: TVP38/TMEM64 family protein [Candidatus Cybelea sp.]|nr:TVP38/TMEM64 family protein [Candidatus Cybelea sp.]
MQPVAAGEGGNPRAWKPRRLWPLILIAAAIALYFALGLGGELSWAGFQARQAEWQRLVRDHYALALLIFMAAYTALVALSIPGAALLTMIGGFLFGAAVATASVVFAATLGATLVFLAARTALSAPLSTRAGPWLARLEQGFRRDQWSYMFFLRLMPIFPFFIVNLAPAFLGVSLRCFVVATFLGIIPATAVYALAGAALQDVLGPGTTSIVQIAFGPRVLAVLVGLAALSLLPVVYRRFRKRDGDA